MKNKTIQRMKKIFLLLLMTATLTANGQNHLLGIESGVALTNATAIGDRFRTSFAIGATYDYVFKNDFSISTGIIYNQRGFRYDIIIRDSPQDPGKKMGKKFKYNYDYVTIPLKVGYSFGHNYGFGGNYNENYYSFVNIGLTPSILIDAKVIEPKVEINGTVVLPGRKHNITKSVNRFDVGGIIEIGGGYKFEDRFWLFLAVSYQHSLTTFVNSEYNPPRHYGIAINLGLKYKLTAAN